jgi:iron complex transport system permease protein
VAGLWLAALGLLVVAVLLSLALGSHPIAPARVWQAIWHDDGSTEAAIVRGQRVPRTVLGLVAGAALGLAGAVMQALTRNPLADPGILGVNAGAALAVVLGVALSGSLGAGAMGIGGYLWLALAGAAIATVGVYVLAGTGRAMRGPARLALAGVAVSAALTALTQTVVLADQEAFNEFRFWITGSLEGRGWSAVWAVGPLLAIGAAVALVLGPALGVLALGEDAARAVGVHLGRTRALAVVAVTLLAGGATAAIGPVGFVGLAAPLTARAVLGHHQRRVALASILLGATWLLLADVLARVVIAPQELAAGVVAAIAGGPVFVALVSRRKVPAL